MQYLQNEDIQTSLGWTKLISFANFFYLLIDLIFLIEG